MFKLILLTLSLITCETEAYKFNKEYLIEQNVNKTEFTEKYPEFNILNDESYEIEDDEFSDLTHDIPMKKRYSDEEVDSYENSSDNPLKFTVTPPTVKYLSRTEQFYILKCTVQQCDTLNIICSDNDYANNNEMGYNKPRINLRGPVSDRRCIGEMKITHRQVENWYSSFSCYCQAWKNNPANGEPYTKRTNKTDIFIASMHRNFQRNPESLKTNEGQSVNLECISPRGKPTPIIVWMRSNHGPVQPTADSRIRIISELFQNSHDTNNLVINQVDETKSTRSRLVIDRVTKEDEGHYFCQAYNLEGIVNSTISSLQIVQSTSNSNGETITSKINGTWSEWSVWESDCSSQKDGEECNQKRKRICVANEGVEEDERVSCTEASMNVEVETRACLVTRNETTNEYTLSNCKLDLKQISIYPSQQTLFQQQSSDTKIREDIVLYLGLTLAIMLFILASATAIYMLIKAGKCFCLQNSSLLQKNLLDKLNSHNSYHNHQGAFHSSTLNDSQQIDSSFIVSLRHSNSLNQFEKSQDARSFYDNKSLKIAPNPKYSSYYFKTKPTDSFIGDTGNQGNFHSSYSQLFTKENQQENDTDNSNDYLQTKPPFSEGIQLPRSYLLERNEIDNELLIDNNNMVDTTAPGGVLYSISRKMPVEDDQTNETLDKYRLKAKTFNTLNQNEGMLGNQVGSNNRTLSKNQEKPPLPRKEREKRLTVNRNLTKSPRPNSVKI